MTELHVGYRRARNRPWERVCSAPTREECWELLRAAPESERHIELEVRREEQGPPPAPKKRRKAR
jgi:hypothetical protein